MHQMLKLLSIMSYPAVEFHDGPINISILFHHPKSQNVALDLIVQHNIWFAWSKNYKYIDCIQLYSIL